MIGVFCHFYQPTDKFHDLSWIWPLLQIMIFRLPSLSTYVFVRALCLSQNRFQMKITELSQKMCHKFVF